MVPFKNILIPVDSVYNSQIALEKAMELGDALETTIHLVSVIRFDTLWQRLFYTEAIVKQQRYFAKRKLIAEKKIDTLKDKIKLLSPNIVVKSAIMIETVTTENLIKYTQQNGVDLVISTNQKASKGFSLFRKDVGEELARKGNVAVLTVTKGCLNHPIKSILLPVTSFVPERKIQMALAFAKKFNAHIHLVTLLDNNNDVTAKIRIDAFYLTYKILTEYGHSPQYKILQGSDNDAALLHYADQIKADMILVNPDKKKRLPGFIQSKITDMLNPLSALHVLTLKPYLKRSI